MLIFWLLWDGGEGSEPDAEYPRLKLDYSSRKVPRDGRVISQEGDGLTRIRTLHEDRADFELVHSGISEADVETLFDFYEAHILDTFTFGWPEDNALYPVKFGGRPQFVERKGNRFTYQVKLLAGVLS